MSGPVSQVFAHLSEWVKWGNENYPIGQQVYMENVKLVTENKKLKDSLDSQHTWAILGLGGIGFGLGVLLVSIRSLWRIWRASPTGKQLTVLVLGAVWISLTALVSAGSKPYIASRKLGDHSGRLFNPSPFVQRNRVLVVGENENSVRVNARLTLVPGQQ